MPSSSLSDTSAMDARTHGCGAGGARGLRWHFPVRHLRHGRAHARVWRRRARPALALPHANRGGVERQKRHDEDRVPREDQHGHVGDPGERGHGAVPVGAQLAHAEPARLRGVQHPRRHLAPQQRLRRPRQVRRGDARRRQPQRLAGSPIPIHHATTAAAPRGVVMPGGVELLAVAPERVRLLPVRGVVADHELVVGPRDGEQDERRDHDVPRHHEGGPGQLLPELPGPAAVERAAESRHG